MASSPRRPLPALIALAALLILAGLVWWRVLNREAPKKVAKPCPTPTASVRLPAQSAVTVDVLNATKRSGIASKARSVLVADGFNSPNTAQNDRRYLNKVKGVALIRYGPAGAAGAKLLRYYFPGAVLTPSTAIKSATVVVSLGDRYTAVATPAQVTAALERDKTVAGTPTRAAGSTCTP